MNKDIRLYISDICKYFGFAFSIPMGRFWLNVVFNEGCKSAIIFIASFLIFSVGVVLFIYGGIIRDAGID